MSPVGPERVDVLPYAVAAERVEADRRLVEDEQAGPVDEGLRQLQPTDHAAGVRLREAVGGVGEPHRVEHLVDPGPRCRLGRSNNRANSPTFSRPVRPASAESCWGT